MDQFAPYAHAIVAMAATALILLAMSPISALKKTAQGLAPGATPEQDYANPCYRWHRAYSNLAESIGPFVAVTIAAILAGSSPFWVNLLASLFVVLRLVLVFVHIKGIGRPEMGPRSFIYVAGWLICAILAVMAIICAICG